LPTTVTPCCSAGIYNVLPGQKPNKITDDEDKNNAEQTLISFVKLMLGAVASLVTETVNVTHFVFAL
jgi:hypothetical protein